MPLNLTNKKKRHAELIDRAAWKTPSYQELTISHTNTHKAPSLIHELNPRRHFPVGTPKHFKADLSNRHLNQA